MNAQNPNNEGTRRNVQGSRSNDQGNPTHQVPMANPGRFSPAIPKRQRVLPDWQCALQDLAEIPKLLLQIQTSNAQRSCCDAMCSLITVIIARDHRGKSAVAADLAGAVHDVVDRFEPGAWFCAMRFWTTVGEAGSKVCRAASRARAFGKLFPDFQLFPLISTWFRSFDNKNNFLSGAALQALWRSGPDSMEPSRLISRNLA
jgi:hypothetical protein